MKNIILILIIVLFISCTTPEREIENVSIITLTNNIIEVELTKTLVFSTASIELKNISNKIIIEIDYSLNDNNYTIYDDIVPHEITQLYFTKNDYAVIDCVINNVIFY